MKFHVGPLVNTVIDCRSLRLVRRYGPECLDIQCTKKADGLTYISAERLWARRQLVDLWDDLVSWIQGFRWDD